jgi:triosephosphate isomerase
VRKKIIIGNWKMHKTQAAAKVFAKETVDLVARAKQDGIILGVAPSYLSLEVVKKHNKRLIVAAQNVHQEEAGAFTGEISLPMLQEIKIGHVILGHSERRQYFNETDAALNLKVNRVLNAGLVPIFCVGETLSEFEAKLTKTVIARQITIGLAGINPALVKKLIVAYEPVWSIGTGKNASPEIAQDICAFIRHELMKMYGKSKANQIHLLYGGSVKPENIKAYLSLQDVDGALVGGASLEVASFTKLVMNLK